MQIKEALRWGHEELLLTSESARLDAEVLLSHILKKPTTFLLAHDEEEIGFFPLWKYRRFISKRKEGIPVAYLTGRKEFFFLDLEVNKHVLVPRPDTEILVEAVIEYLKQLRKTNYELRISLLDVGTGSGCIPIAVLSQADGIRAVATDISSKALKVAKRNVSKHHFRSRIKLIKSDLLKNVSKRLFSGHEVVVTANLPYLPQKMEVMPDLQFEPSISLYGGDDGMEVYRRLIDQLSELKPKAIFLELFESQIAVLKTHLPDYKLKYVKNMSGQARVLVMERDS